MFISFIKIFIFGFFFLSCSDSKEQNNKLSATVDSSVEAVTDIQAEVSKMTDGSGNWQAILSWKSLEDASFSIKRGIKSGVYVDTYKDVKSPYTIHDLAPDTTQYLVVISQITINGTVVSSTSKEYTIKIPLDDYTEKPGAFTMTASPGDTKVTISWQNAERASYYIIQSGLSSGSYPDFLTKTTKSPYTVSGLINGQTRYYMVIAVNSVGNTKASSEVSATPLSSSTNNSLSNTNNSANASNTAAGGSMNLAWSPVNGATSYKVSRGTSASGPFALISSDASSPFVDSNVSDGTTYYYIVTAVTPSGEVTLDTVSAQPGSSTTSNTAAGGAMNLAWSSVDEATSYKVSRGTSASGPFALISSDASSPFVDSNVSDGATYYYIITAVTPSGEIILNTTSAQPGSSTTSNTATEGAINLAWSSVNGATSYKVSRGTSASGPFALVSSLASSPFIDSNLSNGMTYYYIVTAVTPSGEIILNTTIAQSGAPCILVSGGIINNGMALNSCNNQYQLVMQTDGNLVVYEIIPNQARWASNTLGIGSGYYAFMRADGNFVIYDGTNVQFSSNTSNNPGAYLKLEDDGKLKIYRSNNTELMIINP